MVCFIYMYTVAVTVPLEMERRDMYQFSFLIYIH